MKTNAWMFVLALALGCGGNAPPANAPAPAPAPVPASTAAEPAQPHPEVLAMIQRMEARMERLEAQVAELSELQEQFGELRDLAIAAPRPRRPTMHRPDPGVVYAVPIDGAPFSGPEHAKVTVVEGFEFACPFCFRVRPTLDELRKIYGKDLKVVYKHYVVHPQKATLPAQAACAAHLQGKGKFQRYTDLLWSEGFEAQMNFSRENLERLARKARLRLGRWRKDMAGPCEKIVRDDQRELAQVGARGTPVFFINGRFLSGAQPVDAFRNLIDEELAKANAAIDAGTPVEDYYRIMVLEQGEKQLTP